MHFKCDSIQLFGKKTQMIQKEQKTNLVCNIFQSILENWQLFGKSTFWDICFPLNSFKLFDINYIRVVLLWKMWNFCFKMRKIPFIYQDLSLKNILRTYQWSQTFKIKLMHNFHSFLFHFLFHKNLTFIKFHHKCFKQKILIDIVLYVYAPGGI